MSATHCRHIRTNGLRCRSSVVRDKAFCYFHLGVNARRRALYAAPPVDAGPTVQESPLQLNFPTLEDRESIQASISLLLSALGQGRIDPRRASPMLYALQVASSNTRKLDLEPRYTMNTTVPGEDGTDIAPDDNVYEDDESA